MKLRRLNLSILRAFLILNLFIPAAVAGESSGSPATDLRRLQRFHAGRQVPGVGWYINEDYVPKSVALLLTRVKHAMRDQIVKAMAQDVDGAATSEAMQAAITRRFAQAGLKIRRDDDGLYFGRVFLTRPAEVPGHPELRAVTLVIGIPWGDDTSLYIFSRRPSGWELILSSEVNGYTRVYRAQSRLRYAVSPPAADGSWFVVTGSINNHFASNWQQITYAALSPGEGPEHPRILARGQHGIFLGYEDEQEAYQLAVKADGFRISMSFDTAADRPGAMWETVGYGIADGMAQRQPRVCRLNGPRGKAIPCSIARGAVLAKQLAAEKKSAANQRE